MAKVTLDNVSKFYPGQTKQAPVAAVRNVSLTCEEGEFLVLLGPSGCGKTSMLRMIAGLEDISAGTIYIGERPVNDLSPKERNVAMAFENYALYPPLSVEENLSFPLKAGGLPKSEIEKKVADVSGLLQIGDILERRPGELSGGQQQLISLGRCIIRDSDVHLLDEPLSHLDSELRLQIRSELKRIHAAGNRTFIYVTHDQIEALALADRIAVMDNGIIQQIGIPKEVFEYPVNLFVAGFIGEPPMNFINGALSCKNGKALFSSENGALKLDLHKNYNQTLEQYRSRKLVLAIRPHYLHLGSAGSLSKYNATAVLYESLGEDGVLEVRLGDQLSLIMLTEPDLEITPGALLPISVDWTHAQFFDADSGQILTIE